MTPEEKEAIIAEVTERVSNKLVPRMDEWFETFRENFVDSFVTTFDAHFEQRMKSYVASVVFSKIQSEPGSYTYEDPSCD